MFDDASTTAPNRDSVTFPRFYVKAVENAFRSQEAGRPIFDEKEYIHITIAGQKSEVDRKVTEEDRQRFPREYAAFKANAAEVLNGTPLSEWPALTVTQIAEFNALNIRTVEALANIDDVAIGKIGTGGRTIRDRAKAWLEQANGGAPLDKALADLSRAEADAAVKDATIKAQTAEIERLKALVVEKAQ